MTRNNVLSDQKNVVWEWYNTVESQLIFKLYSYTIFGLLAVRQ